MCRLVIYPSQAVQNKIKFVGQHSIEPGEPVQLFEMQAATEAV